MYPVRTEFFLLMFGARIIYSCRALSLAGKYASNSVSEANPEMWVNIFDRSTHIKRYASNITPCAHLVGYSAWNQSMMTSSNGNFFRVTGPLCGEFTGPGEFTTKRPVMRSFDVYFDLRLNKRLSKQPWGWWFETLSWSLWRQCNAMWWPSERY